ncbi:MAG TPA: RNA polymerase factor sigma-54 [Myxococcaceae bacterium]|nr:RNA polymerase factor sigma-54 [Myxococcaceae bacterium]
MAMELKQSLRMTQQLVMTPQLQQAIKLLQLGRMDLLEQVREEMEQNPVLEQAEERLIESVEGLDAGEASFQAENTEPPPAEHLPERDVSAEVQGAPEDAPEIDWESFLNSNQFGEGHALPSNRGLVDSEDFPSFESTLVEKEDLAAHLWGQLRFVRMNDAERRIALLIVHNLDDDGYLRLEGVEGDPLIRLVDEADVPMSLGNRVLRRIQRLDPVGCGARDLKECLLLQAAALKDPSAPLLATLLGRYVKQLERRNLPAIAKDLGIEVEEVAAAHRLMMRLDPRPGRNFSGDDAQAITPDVFVYKLEDGYTVVLNDDGLSKLRISGAYRAALKGGQVEPGQTRDFIQEKLKSALWLLRSIHQRQRTILKVTESIVKFQQPFLDHGTAHLRPLILRDVAEDIGMHESTVSRVTSNKYVSTPQGVFELKYFFNSSIARVAGEDTASEAVKHHIKQLIAKEDPKAPYSDQKLVELLRGRGIDIARRTVAKYREVLGILPSSKRRSYV